MLRRRRKVLATMAAVPAIGLAAGATAISRDLSCDGARPLPAAETTMRAVVYGCYGGSAVLEVQPVERPVPAGGEVLVRVHAAALNPHEWHYMQGRPFVMRLPRAGSDQGQEHRPDRRARGGSEPALASRVRPVRW
jgi:hypothetical protein